MCLFIKRFEELHEIAAQHYLRKEKEEFYVLFRKILLLQKNGKVEEILTKKYQYKNRYQGKFTDRGISKAPLIVIIQNIYLFLICLTKKIITKELDFKV